MKCFTQQLLQVINNKIDRLRYSIRYWWWILQQWGPPAIAAHCNNLSQLTTIVIRLQHRLQTITALPRPTQPTSATIPLIWLNGIGFQAEQ